MSTVLNTPPRGTQSSAAAFFATPSSPVPRRPANTPTSLAASPLSQRRTGPHPHHPRTPSGFPASAVGQRASLTPHSSQSSIDRYVSAPSRHHTSIAHFLLTSAEQKTPMLIRNAQQQQISALRSPSRESSLPPQAVFEDAYPSPTRYAVDRSSPTGGAASPRPHGSLPRAGSTRLSSVFAKMHLDPSVRSSRERSVSTTYPNAHLQHGNSAVNASFAGDAGGLGSALDDADEASSPPTFSFASTTMDLEPYTTKLARTLFSDVAQTTVLSVNDTAMRPTATPATAGRQRKEIRKKKSNASSNSAFADSFAAASLRTPDTPRSPEVTDPSLNFASAFPADTDDEDGSNSDRDDGLKENDNHSEDNESFYHRTKNTANEEAEEDEEEEGREEAAHKKESDSDDGGDAENNHRRRRAGGYGGGGGGLFRHYGGSADGGGFSRVPLSNSDVNLFGMSEGARYDASLGVVFECNRTRNFTSPSFRVIPHTPERILDAAEMEDDFYMNLIDWSAAADVLCVALQSCIYLWDAKTGGITELPRVTSKAFPESRTANAQLVCGLNWAPDGRRLAVGRNSGLVEVWDVEAQQVVHAYRQHTDRTVSLAWEPQGGSLLASGSRDSTIVLRDVRERDAGSLYGAFSAPAPPSASSDTSLASAVSVLQGHETEVCGLKWSPTGALLASGGNDNQLLLWDRRCIGTGNNSSSASASSAASSPFGHAQGPQPVFYLNKHTAAVKALSWNPMQPALLASGGGSHDKSLRFWNTLTGECVHHINTGSQVCGVVWNRTGTELVTAHGYTDNQLSIWRYPSLRRIANLIGHTSRVLHLALSADGETVVSAAGDETLRFWRCFPPSELRESSPHLYRSFYSPSSASSLTGSPYAAAAVASGGGGGSPGISGSATRARAAAIAAGRCGSASQDRASLSFMNEEVELR